MRRFLPLFFLLFVLFSFFPKVYAQTPTSVLNGTTVHSQGLLDDFFAWLGNILFKDQIPQKVCDVNKAGSPYATPDPSGNCDSSQTVSTQASGQSGNADDALKQASRQYDTAADRNTPFNQGVDNRNFIQKWWESLTLPQVVPTGTQQAKVYVSTNLPFGVEVLPTPSDENSAMAYALDCKKDSTLPVGANPDSKCIPTNRPEYISPTPTPTITPTPEISIYPTGGVSYDSCPVGNDKCMSKSLQEAGKPGDPDYYRRNKCYWGNFLPAFSGNEVKARAASAICFRESGGDVINLNDHCLSKYPIDQRTRDYSIGLFQINLLAHCPGALRDDWNVNQSCTIVDQAKLNACYAQFTTFDGAVSKMLDLSQQGTNWNAWLTHYPEKYCEVTNDQMMCMPPPVTPISNTLPNGNYVYYSQKDYSTTPYGLGCTIYDSGCGPTTLAMILSTYLGTSWTPPIVASTLLSGQSCQTYLAALKNALTQERFKADYLFAGEYKILSDADKAIIRNKIRNGATILAGASMGWYDAASRQVAYGGHYFWITDIDDAGTIYVMDPWYGAGRPYPIAQQNINSYPVYYRHIIVAYKP